MNTEQTKARRGCPVNDGRRGAYAGWALTHHPNASRLSLRNFAGYAAGDAAHSFVFILQAMFLLIYYTDVLGLEPGPVAAIIFGVRLWSSASDLIARRLVDLTRTRCGRFHPWLVGASVPMLLTGVALVFLRYPLNETQHLAIVKDLGRV